jgi:ferrochelatase
MAAGRIAWVPHGPSRDVVHARNSLLQSMKHSLTPMADSSSRFGFVAFAETWNGRLAMLGFVIGLATELLTGQGILSQIGLG